MSDEHPDPASVGLRSVQPVCLLGSEGSGKTCFLAGLAVLREPNRPSALTVIPTDTVTVEYLDELAQTLRCGQWPPPTNMTTLLRMRVGLDGKAIETLMVDYPGEDFRNELRKLKREDIEILYDHYAHSESILLLFDPDQDVRALHDPARRSLQIERQLAHLQAIADIWAERTGGVAQPSQRHVDVAIIVTKADRDPALTGRRATRRFFRDHAGALDAKIRQQAHLVEYFPLSAVGQSCMQEVDGRQERFPAAELSPTGYDAIFDWVVNKQSRRTVRRRLKTCGALLALLTIFVGLGMGWRAYQQSRSRDQLADPRLSSIDKLKLTQSIPSLPERSELITTELERYREAITAATDEPSLNEVLERLRELEEIHPGAIKSRIDEVKQEAKDKNELLLYQRTKDGLDNQSADFRELAERFLQEYPGSSRCEDVRKWISQSVQRDHENDRQRIKNLQVVDKASLGEKSERLVEFVQKYEAMLTSSEAKRIRRAAELAKQFCELNTYTLTLKRYGGFAASRSQSLLLYLDGQKFHEYPAPSASKEVTWSESPLRIQWKAGQAVRVVLRNYTWRNADVAWSEDKGPTALRILGGERPFAQVLPDWTSYVENPFAQFEVADITSDDLRALDQYILPGVEW